MLSFLQTTFKYVRITYNLVRPLLEMALRKKVLIATASAGGATALVPMEMREYLARRLLSQASDGIGMLFGSLEYFFPFLEVEVFDTFTHKVYEASAKIRYPYGMIVFD